MVERVLGGTWRTRSQTVRRYRRASRIDRDWPDRAEAAEKLVAEIDWRLKFGQTEELGP